MVTSQTKNKTPNAMPAATGMVCNKAAGDLPKHKQRQPVTDSEHAIKQGDFRPTAGQRPERERLQQPDEDHCCRKWADHLGGFRCIFTENFQAERPQHKKTDCAKNQGEAVKARII